MQGIKVPSAKFGTEIVIQIGTKIQKLFSLLHQKTFYFLAILILSITTACNFRNPAEALQINNPEKVDFVGIYGTDSLEVTRQENDWQLKGGWAVEPAMIDNFLYAFQNLEIVGASTGASLDSLVSKRIEFIENGRIKKLRFYSGKGIYLLHHEGSVKIYRIQLKGRPEADLDKVFSDKFSEWQSRRLLDFSNDELKEIRVFPGKEYGPGFVMEISGDSVTLFMEEGGRVPADLIDPEKIILYQSYFDEVYIDSEVESDSIKDRIKASDPFFRFFVKSSQKTVDFRVFPLYLPKGEKDIFYGIVTFGEDSRLYKVNYVFLDLIFQDINYFRVE